MELTGKTIIISGSSQGVRPLPGFIAYAASEGALHNLAQSLAFELAEKELPFETVFLELGKKDQLKPEYLKLNPNGVVPTLVDGDDVILESSVICEYLDERYPGFRTFSNSTRSIQIDLEFMDVARVSAATKQISGR